MKFLYRLIQIVLAAVLLAGSVLSAKAEDDPNYSDLVYTYDIEFTDWQGNSYRPEDFEEESVLLIFGRLACGNTMATVRNAEKLINYNYSVKAVLLLIDDYHASTTVEETSQNYPDIIISDDYDYNNNLGWKLAHIAGLESGLLPFVFLMNQDREIYHSSTGLDNATKAILTITGGVIPGEEPEVPEYLPIVQSVSRRQNEARTMLEMINDLRTGDKAWAWDEEDSEKIYYEGLGELTYDYELEKAAMIRAAELSVYYSHSRPDMTSCFTAYPDAFSGGYMGENIAIGYKTPQAVFEAWCEEDEDYSGQGHRRNMLGGNFSSVGIACAEIDGYKYWVQEFSSVIADTNPVDYDENPVDVEIKALKKGCSIRLYMNDMAYFRDPQATMDAGTSMDIPQADSYLYFSGSAVKKIAEITTPVSSDESIVKTDDKKVYALKAGTAVLQYTDEYEGLTGSLDFTITVNEHEHNYELGWWIWAKDYSSAEAVFECSENASHKINVPAEVTSKTKEPTCTDKGKTVYTASVTFEDKNYTDTKETETDALGHNYGKPEYIWSKSYGNATAKAVCERCKEEISETVKSKYEVIKEPSCEEKGLGRYTAEFKNELFETQTVEIDISALGHDYQLTEWKWSEDDTQAWAVFTCQNDESHVQTIEAEVESDGIYATATVVFEDKTYTTRKQIGEILPISIVISTKEAEMPTESTLQLTAAVILPSSEGSSDEGNKVIIWTSSDEEIATVDQNGLVKALRYGKVTITATSAANPALTATCQIQTRFYDVNDSKKYYYEPVYWAADKEITTGYDRVYFGPQKNCTRQELAIFLWRLAGKPEVSGELPFSDTKYKEESASFQAILWCSQQGIVRGYSDGTFKPKANVSRKDTLIMLYRLAGKPDVSGTIKFPDVLKENYDPNSDTYKAILWGVQNGITNGYKDGNFQPKTKCLREHIVTFIHRADKVINN